MRAESITRIGVDGGAMRIGVYLGSRGASTDNAARVFEAYGAHLAGEHEVDAFGGAPIPEGATPHYAHVERTPYDGGGALAEVLAAYRAARRYCRRRSPDLLVQLWKYKVHAPGTCLGGRTAGVPVLTRLQVDAFGEYRAFEGFERARIYALDHVIGRIPRRLSSGTIVLGPYGRSELRARGVDDGRITVLPPPLDPRGRFHPPTDSGEAKRTLDLPEDRPIVLYAGRLSEQKGMPFLRRVVERVTARSDVLFLLVGDGPFRRRFAERFDRGTVRLAGHVPHDRMPAYYRAADVYAHPSPYEGIPLVVLEALETELPVVARDAGDIAAVIDTVVETPEEMANWLVNGPWRTEWLNRASFDPEHQRRTLLRAAERAAERG
jgi:glycosyltransferase involved in cell wall biosynthesis